MVGSHLISSLTAACLAAGVAASPVNIRLFNTHSATARCNTGQILECPDIERYQCCYVPGLGFQQALFDFLPTEGMPAQGVVFQEPDEDGCGKSVDAGFGSDLCLMTPADGAAWYYKAAPTAAAEKRDMQQRNATVYPLRLRTAGGRSFSIFYDVPQEVTNQMLAFWADGTDIQGDVPESFLPYELL